MIDWLTDSLLATSLLMALVLLIREPVRRHFGPSAAYGLWLIPALRVAMPPLTWTVERSVPEAATAAMLPLAPLQTGQPQLAGAAEPGLVARMGGPESVAVSAWLAGAAILLLAGAMTYRRQRCEVLRHCEEVTMLGRIRIVRSAAVRGPVAFGIFDRVIALPVDFDERFEPRERRLAFEHELSHHRSGDLIVNHAAFVLLCLQWFNPLAWVSHSAFRFDQESACDARILAEASGRKRALYAGTIAKAASGRTLMFAGALGRPGTLHKRIRFMLSSPSSSSRLAGKILIALTGAVAIPLTASWATHYVDAPSRQQNAGTAAPQTGTVQPHASGAAAAASVAPPPGSRERPAPAYRVNGDGTVTLAGGVTLGKGSTAFFANDDILINGQVKRLDQMTTAERAEIRATILRSQRDLARDRAEMPSELADLRREGDRARSGQLRREIMESREDLRRELAEVGLEASGEAKERRKTEILRDLREAEAIDIDRLEREAIEDADPEKRLAELRADEAQMARLLAGLNALDRR